MDFLYEPMDDSKQPTGFEPLEWDDEVYDDDDDNIYFEDPIEEDEDEEDEYLDQSFGGWDDLKPFGSFDSGMGWDEPLFW